MRSVNDLSENMKVSDGIIDNSVSVSRDKVIVRTSIIGILANVFLAGFKALVGLMSNSIAITLDAVNNLSDAASSVITIVGTKLAGKEPDKKHPFGYGRIEYLSAMIISLIVLYAGITSFTESVKKIITPEKADYSAVVLIVVAVGVAVKIVLGRYVKSVGKKVNSDSLVNSGEDATLDSIISASTLVAAVIYMIWGLSLEAWLGAIISIIIIKSGIDMLRETLSQILGERADITLVKDIKKTVCSFPEVKGAYDLILNNYGPDKFNGSVHIGIADTYTANEIDDIIRRITMKVYYEHDVILTAIGVYSVNTKDKNVVEKREAISKAIMADKYIHELHGFYVYEDEKKIRFDLVVSFDSPNRAQTYANAVKKAQELYPDYTLEVAMDTDFSEE